MAQNFIYSRYSFMMSMCWQDVCPVGLLPLNTPCFAPYLEKHTSLCSWTSAERPFWYKIRPGTAHGASLSLAARLRNRRAP